MYAQVVRKGVVHCFCLYLLVGQACPPQRVPFFGLGGVGVAPGERGMCKFRS